MSPSSPLSSSTAASAEQPPLSSADAASLSNAGAQQQQEQARQATDLVRLCGSVWTECGYCKGERAAIVEKDRQASSKAYSVLANRLKAATYEDFLYRGWRRSGSAMYKPNNWISCCPALTIRLPIAAYEPTKSQRKVMRKMESLLNPNIKKPLHKKEDERESDPQKQVESTVLESELVSRLQECALSLLRDLLGSQVSLLDGVGNPTFRVLRSKKRKTVSHSKLDQNGTPPTTTVTLFTPICAALAGRSRGRLEKSTLAAGLVTGLEQAMAKDRQAGKRHRVDPGRVTLVSIQFHDGSGQVLVDCKVTSEKSPISSSLPKVSVLVGDTSATKATNVTDPLAAWWAVASSTEAVVHPRPPLVSPRAVTVQTLPAHVSALDPAVCRLYFDYQHHVHDDPHPLQDRAKSRRQGKVEDGGEDEAAEEEEEVAWGQRGAPEGWLALAQKMLQEEYKEFSESQKRRISRSYGSFYEFLVENPFVAMPPTESGVGDTTLTPGTYHQHYKISGHLIAVGVVDLLPKGLSSVYLFYDPSFAHQLCPLGKYAILKEIEFTQTAGLPYYYLGYYIESCQKMRYKSEYRPSQLLCPKYHQWVDAEEGVAKIQEKSPLHHCCPLVDSGEEEDDEDDLSLSDNEDEEEDDDGSDNDALDGLAMEVGIGSTVLVSMLNPAGQSVVRPLLKEFLREAGAGLAAKCTVDFR